MVTLMNVKIKTIPVDRGFFLISLGLNINYSIFAILMQVMISWRLRAIDDALKLTIKSNQKIILRKMKLLMKVLCIIEDLINSRNNYVSLSNILSFANFFVTSLMILFLGYDVFAHNLGNDDLTLFLGGISFSFFAGLACFIAISYSISVARTIKKAIKIFNKIQMKFNDDAKIQKYCNLANLQLSSVQSEFSCGLFDFNYKLIFTLMSSIFAYLVMMIQFDYMLTIRRKEMNFSETDVLFL